jgi:hypothetical protein
MTANKTVAGLETIFLTLLYRNQSCTSAQDVTNGIEAWNTYAKNPAQQKLLQLLVLDQYCSAISSLKSSSAPLMRLLRSFVLV